MRDQIFRALERAAAGQPFTPDICETLRLGRRRKARRQRSLIAGAVLGLGVIATAITIVLPRSHEHIATVAPVSTSSVATPSAAPTSAPARTPADPAVVTHITTLSPGVFAAAGIPATSAGIKSVSGSVLQLDGKPGVFWDGAEYCPYCASQRWPLVVALSRFGTWSGLTTTTSATEDVYPNTSTFSFYGATYSSQYLSFQSVETATNRPVGSGYEPLQALTAAQTALVQRYDPQQSIPFIDFGNTFTMTGTSYDPAVLKDFSPSKVAAAISDPTTQVGKDVLSTANVMTAAICRITANQPGDVCQSQLIARLNSYLNAPAS